MKPLLGRRSFNDRGSAFVQALVAIAVVGALLYWLSPRVIKQREQVTKTASIITARLAMHSMLDYTLLGIKQRWCFSETWMPESCGANTAQMLSHKRSVERILMKGDTVEFLKNMGIPNADNIPIKDKIEADIKIQNFTALHPVYRIIADLKNVKVSSVKVTISREAKRQVPEYGREVYLSVSVELLDENGKVIQVGSSYLQAKSFVGVYPREVGSFALLIPGNLHLESESAGRSKPGDVYILKTGSREARIQAGLGNLVFDSPVFVNGDIILPKDGPNAGDTTYTPVAFKEKVIIGDGAVMRDGTEFRPRTAGAENDQFWTSIREFGGFLKGVDVDGSRDLGLDVLAGKPIEPLGDPNLMQTCIQRTLAMNDLSKTSKASLMGELRGQTEKKFDYRLGMDLLDRFTRQRGQVQVPNPNDQNLIVASQTSVSAMTGAVAGYRMEVGALRVTGDIPDNGTVTIAPKIDLRPLEANLQVQVRDLQNKISDANSDIPRLENRIRNLKGNLDDAKDDLDQARSKTIPDPIRIAYLQGKIFNINSDIQDAQKDLADAKNIVDKNETQLAGVQKALDAVRANMQVQPKISMTIDVPNPDKGSNPSFKDFHVNFDHGEVIVDRMGNPLPVKVYLEAYDVGYDQGNPLRPNYKNMKTHGWINFARRGTDFVASGSLVDEDGQSRGAVPEGDINQDIDGICSNIGTSSSTAFGGVDWSTSFAGNARHSWSFTNSYDSRTDVTFNAMNASRENGTATFIVKSTARNCIVESTANFVSGFLTCDNLTIQPRSTPLRIIGSIIIMNSMTIAPQAIDAGIRWSTIYQPMATFELRQAGVLTGQNGVSCNAINRFPVWHPVPSVIDVSNLYRCNAISLRSKADPFRWTSVDPDCGLVKNANSTKCKNRMVNFYVLEVSRESGI